LVDDFRRVPEYAIDLGGSLSNLGHLQLTNHQLAKALESHAKAVATLEEVMSKFTVDGRGQRFLRNAYWGQARVLDDQKNHTEAVKKWDKAIELSPKAQRPLFRMNRAVSRVRAGQFEAALQEVQEFTNSTEKDTLYNAACVFALAAGRREEAGASLAKEECARRAVALLRQAVAKGWKDPKDIEHMKKDEDLEALRGREDFQKLLAELEAANTARPGKP
jgi:tetratricopeptide (TPR) repeat protein